ncbi:MAG: SUMF1/EgtB/PvdO family nonheme iron enzyme [Lewinellaceae bacterium]|nr:SUMF1/EgtB/PvdO family nonheme iron enzyme [Lewinellaceae bacterium]
MAKEIKKGVDLKAAERSKPQGLNYLLAVAINDYEHHPKLSNCVRDAERLLKVLQDRYSFRPEETTMLFDKDATAANLHKSLVLLKRKVTAQDNVVIYFSGHGFFDRDDQTGHLVPVEAQEGAVWQFFSNANLVNRIRAINSFHTFLIVDSCFSGSLFASKEVSATPFAEKVEGLPSRWALAAGQIEKVEDGLHGDHSPFAKALLAFLEKNSSPLVPVSDLIQHVKRVTPHNARQTPVGGVLFQAGDVGGEFVFHLKQDEAKAWAEAKRLNTLSSYDDYLDAYPQGRHAEEAEERMEALDEENAWKQAVARGTLPGFSKYLRAYPAGKYAEEARKKKQELKAGPEPRPKPIMAKKVEEPPPKPTPPPREKPAEKKQHIALKNMVFIEGGSFEMGDLFGDGPGDEKPIHRVKVSDFYLGACTITFEEYDAFCQATKRDKPDDSGWGRGYRPMINVSWFDAVEYCNWRSKQEGLEPCFQWTKEVVEEKSFFGLIKGRKEIEKIYCDFSLNGYRLPTEAEWEYAARQQGQKVRFGNGKDIADPAEINYDGSKECKVSYSQVGAYRGKTTQVGSFAPNSLGLYDMSGNVWEWCWDWYGDYPSSAQTNPLGPDSGSDRVLRGGSWDDGPAGARCAYRYGNVPDHRNRVNGFRLARAGR